MRLSAEELGSTEVAGKALTMEVLKQLIELVRCHVSVVVSKMHNLCPSTQWRLSQTEAGCRVLINLILLRVASIMSIDYMDVNIIPEFPIAKTVFPGNRSFGGVVDFLLTKLPEKYSRRGWNCRSGCRLLTSCLQNFSLLILRECSPIRTKSRELSHQTYLRQSETTCERLYPKPSLPRHHIVNSISTISPFCSCSQTYRSLPSLPVMRGCITSGEQWVFFIYEKRDNDKGHVSASVEYAIGPQCEGLGLILGLLHDWVCDSQSECWPPGHNYSTG